MSGTGGESDGEGEGESVMETNDPASEKRGEEKEVKNDGVEDRWTAGNQLTH